MYICKLNHVKLQYKVCIFTIYTMYICNLKYVYLHIKACKIAIISM